MTEAKKQNESTETALMEGWYWVTIDDDKTPVIAHLTAWGGW